MRSKRFVALAAAVVLAISAQARAAEPEKKPAEKKPAAQRDPKHATVYLTAEEAGPDGATQGEYAGPNWGAQVVALGDGKFHAVLMPGGLPGAGWDAKTRYESEGERGADGVVTLKGVDKVAWTEGHFAPPGVVVKHGFDVSINGDKLSAKTDTGEQVTLTRTVRHSPTEGLKPPAGAIVLFDGSNVDAWKGTSIVDKGPYQGTLKYGGETKQQFTDYTLHVEFLLPLKPWARSQERGNSGVYNQHRYETQVLDSFGVMGMDNQCGGIYTKKPADVNMAFPPLTWQTYDIEFQAARYEGGKKTSDAVITVKHNGVQIHDHVKVDGPTGGGQKETPDENVQTGPLYLQDHGNPVFYRNVWIVEKK